MQIQYYDYALAGTRLRLAIEFWQSAVTKRRKRSKLVSLMKVQLSFFVVNVN